MVLVLLSLNACKTVPIDCSKCPTINIDSTFVLDTVVKLQSDTVLVTVQLDNFQKEQYRKVLDNDTTEVYAKWLEKWGNSKERVEFKIITKERYKKLNVPDTVRFLNTIRELRSELSDKTNTLSDITTELTECKQKPKQNPLTTIYMIAMAIAGLFVGVVITKLFR